ncbi:GGDEF domain-containing protein [Desulfitobacterium sp.]|uniref:GGDEF domain-containing protein n=1 Tax=Desulfitobacterium sp. TaxID=49981 RepID=UPI002C57ADFA|nr:GGDEF domain-containing protein [Desulfitobacterium sp.]HVJ49692.1 GGDEF domain-containing protein [Desulfitobacterium sp.]
MRREEKRYVVQAYGHSVGDRVLKLFSVVLSDSVKRESNWVARYGGEEFLICLPGANLESACKIAETMRKAIEDEVIISENKSVKITASFGVHSIESSEGETVRHLIECADKALYAAKNKGRNRVEWIR